MSKIAEALSKAKERTGNTTAPFIAAAKSSPVAPDPAKALVLRQAAKARRFWIMLLTIAGLGTAFLLWDRLRPEDPAPSPPPRTAARPTPSPAPVATPATADAPPAAPAAPRVEIQNAVNALVITAVLPGERPRLMYRGRIVAIGEPVADNLVFAGVRDGLLLFTDARGASYSRRY